MTRISRERRRIEYLDIGAGLVAAAAGVSDPGLALAHVKVTEVAEQAGVTKGALYHLWPSQEAFWHDLLEYLIENDQLFGPDRLAAIGEEVAAASGAPPTLRRYANALFDSLRADPSFFTRVSLASYLHDEAVRAALDHSFRASVERLIPLLEASIDSMDRRLIPGATVWDFAVAIASLLEGLCLQFRISADRTPDLPLPDGARWTLFAAAAEALLMGYTEPLDAEAT